jgi:hypothetical protein
MRIRRPVTLQAAVLVLVAAAGALATLRYDLLAVCTFCLFAAIASGLAKLAVDASIQEKIDERVRASAFAHAETFLMVAWVAGGAVGLIPLHGQVGVGAAATFAALAAVRAVLVAGRLRQDRLHGRAAAREPSATRTPPVAPAGSTAAPAAPADGPLAPPGYHVYRPSAPSEDQAR